MKQLSHIHFIGIGGIGMSALAQHYYRSGVNVTGSDMYVGKMTDFLFGLGIHVDIGHDASQLPISAELVVISLAIDDTNPELKVAKERGIPVMTYPELLGELTKDYLTIAVAGSHGKTSTTAMIAKVMIDFGLDPTVVLGSTANFLDNGGNYHYGRGKYLVIEACEYYAGFLHLDVDIAIVVNVEHDHFDAYPTSDSYLAAFLGLLDGANSDYPAIVNVDFPLGEELVSLTKHNVVEFSKDQIVPQLRLSIPGEHNRTNAMAVYKLGEILNLDLGMLLDSLANFTGTARRLELKEVRGSCVMYSDYAHHPTEIKASLSALREKYPDAKIGVVFQAHQHHRTKELLNDFGEAFSLADEVVIAPIYAARDSNELKTTITAEVLAAKIAESHKNVKSVTEEASLIALVTELSKKLDVLVLMGAGDVEKWF